MSPEVLKRPGQLVSALLCTDELPEPRPGAAPVPCASPFWVASASQVDEDVAEQRQESGSGARKQQPWLLENGWATREHE